MHLNLLFRLQPSDGVYHVCVVYTVDLLSPPKDPLTPIKQTKICLL